MILKITCLFLMTAANGLAFWLLMKDCINSCRERKEHQDHIDPIKDKLLFIEQCAALLVGTHFGYFFGTLVLLLLKP